MYRPKWTRFAWELPAAIPDNPGLPGKLEIRPFEEGESTDVWNVIERSYASEQGWGLILPERLGEMREAVLDANNHEYLRLLALVDGKRIVGASGLHLHPESQRQMFTGICVLEEYRCRGAGRGLLIESLRYLAGKDLKSASVVSRSNLVASKFLYPLFGSRSSELDALPELGLLKTSKIKRFL